MKNEKNVNLALTAIIFLAAFGLYLSTMAPTVTFGDSGELMAASHSLGISHPTGFPVYMMLGKIFSMVPLANIAFRFNLMSALFAALVPALLFQLFLIISTTVKNNFVKYFVSFTAAVLFIFSYTLWSQSGMARIYTLNAVFCAIALIIFFTYTERSKDAKLLYLLAFLTGAGSGLHLTFTITCGLLWIFIAVADFKFFFKSLFWIIVFFLTGLSTYFFIMLRGSTDTLMQWKKFATSDDFYSYITQQQYKRKMFARDGAGFAAFYGYIKTVVLRELSPAGIILAVAGALTAFIRKNRYALLLLGLCIVNVIVLSLYGDYSDLKLAFRYLIPSYMAGLIFVFIFFEYAASLIKNKTLACGAVFAAFFTTTALSLPVNFYENNKSIDFVAYFFPKDILENIPAKSSLFAIGDNQTYPLAYFKYVLKLYPDIRIFDLVPTVFKDIEDLGKDSRHSSLSNTIIEVFSKGYYPVYSINQSTAKIFKEMPYGVIFSEADTPIAPITYPWKLYSMKGITNDAAFFHDFEEREVVGNYLLRYGQYRKLVNDFTGYEYMLEKAAETSYDNLPVITNVAIEYVNNTITAGSLTRAETLLKAAEKLNPNNPELLFNFGSFYGKIGKAQLAANYFDRVISLDPRNITAMLYKNRAISQAQTEYERQIKLGKEQIMHYQKGLELFNAKKNNEAMKEFELDISLNPGMGRSYFYKGLILSMDAKYIDAIVLYEKVLQLDPNNLGALNNAGLCHMNLKHWAEAKSYFKRSLAVKPDQDRIKKIYAELEKKY